MYNRYWEDHPPLHIIAAAYCGFKKKEYGEFEDLVDQLSNTQQGGVG